MPEPAQPTSNQRAVAALMWRKLVDLPSVATDWPTAIGRGCVAAACFAVGNLAGNPEAAMFATMGALNMGMVSSANRRGLVLLGLVGAMTATYVGGVLAMATGGGWEYLLVLAAAGVVFGIVASRGFAQLNSAFIGLLTIVILSSFPMSLSQAARSGLWLALGAAVMMAWVMASYGRETRGQVVQAIREATRRTRQALEHSEDLGRLLLQASSQSARAEGVVNAVTVATAIRAAAENYLYTLDRFRIYATAWARDHPNHAITEHLRHVARHCQQSLRRPVGRRAGERPQFDTASVTVDHERHIVELADDLLRALDALVAAARASTSRESPAASTPGHDQVSSREPQPAKTRRPIRRGDMLYAARMAIALVVSYVIAERLGYAHPYWAPLAVSLVLKPGFVLTVARGELRAVGNILGVLVMAAVYAMTGDPLWLVIVLLFVTLPLIYRTISGNYAIASFFIACTIILMIESGGYAPLWWDRIVNTVIGCAVAILISLVWPQRHASTLRRHAARAADSHADWLRIVAEAWQSHLQPGAAQSPVTSREARAARLLCRDAMIDLLPEAEETVLYPGRSKVPRHVPTDLVHTLEEIGAATSAIQSRLALTDAPVGDLADWAVIHASVSRLKLCAASLDASIVQLAPSESSAPVTGTPPVDRTIEPALHRYTHIVDDRSNRLLDLARVVAGGAPPNPE